MEAPKTSVSTCDDVSPPGRNVGRTTSANAPITAYHGSAPGISRSRTTRVSELNDWKESPPTLLKVLPYSAPATAAIDDDRQNTMSLVNRTDAPLVSSATWESPSPRSSRPSRIRWRRTRVSVHAAATA